MTRQRAKLVVANQAIEFNGMLHGLRLWARTAGLLRGRRSRAVEEALAKLRNCVAHPSSHHIDTPVEAARTVRDLAELINQLWGHATPGGRLYPAPLRREIIVLSWNGSGRARMEAASALTVPGPVEDQEDDEYQHVVVRALPFVAGSRWDDPGGTTALRPALLVDLLGQPVVSSTTRGDGWTVQQRRSPWAWT
ncbi:hypothetical protein ACFVGN_21080 [Streptomyces sp. NPDC057757]|uniref:hypothetical protein n=1 Tax=Streptomyces sp. NPDC057757 TaxID=3346241 RepID=UPI0036917A4F